MEQEEKKIYYIACHYVSSDFPSYGRVNCRNSAEALEWAERYYSTWCMSIAKIEISNEVEVVLTKDYTEPKKIHHDKNDDVRLHQFHRDMEAHRRVVTKRAKNWQG